MGRVLGSVRPQQEGRSVPLQRPQGEDKENRVHVYTLYPKYTSVPIKMIQIQSTLLERGLKRLDKLPTTGPAYQNNSLAFPVHDNIYPDGLYYMTLLVGSPSKLYFLDMDTGSDLTWLQWDAPRRNCATSYVVYPPDRPRPPTGDEIRDMIK